MLAHGIRIIKGLQRGQARQHLLSIEQLKCLAADTNFRSCVSTWRGYATPAREEDEEDDSSQVSERVQRLAEEIMHLNLLEVADLTDILGKRLNLSPGMGAMQYGMMQPGAPAGQAAPAAAAAPAAEKAPEKTEFDVKLEGFDAASKLKLVKELKVCIPELSLKEAKEQVDKAPNVLKTSLGKEEAEELKKKLEAVGAKITLT